MSSLTCPKCHGTMRTYERSNVHVDQCTECRGIFLDRGELDHLIDGEQQWASEARAATPPPPQQQYQQPPQPPQHYGSAPHSGHQSGHHSGKPSKKRKSFFEDLFE